MKTDLYTKVVLTVIAVLLTLNLIKTDGFITKANASAAGGYVHVPLNADGSINVKVVEYATSQDVVITGWKLNQELYGNVNTFDTSGLPVKIK